MTEYYYTFKLADADKQYKSVSVAGTFNSWKAATTPLAYDTKNGVWTTKITLSSPKFTYKYVADDEWILDASAPLEDDSHGNPNNYGVAVSSDPSQDQLESDVNAVVGDYKSAINSSKTQSRKEWTGKDKEEKFEGDVNQVDSLITSANNDDYTSTKKEFSEEADKANNPGLDDYESAANAAVNEADANNAVSRLELAKDALETETGDTPQNRQFEADAANVVADYDLANGVDQAKTKGEFQLEADADENELNLAQTDADALYAGYKTKDAQSHAQLQNEFRERSDVGLKQTEQEINDVVGTIDEANAEDQLHAKKDFTEDAIISSQENQSLIQKVSSSIKWFVDHYILAFFRN